MTKSKHDELDVALHALSKLTKGGGRYDGFDPEPEGITDTKFHEKTDLRHPKGIYFLKEKDVVEYSGKEVFVTIKEYEDSLLELASAKLTPLLAKSSSVIEWEYLYAIAAVAGGTISNLTVNSVDLSDYRDFQEFNSSNLSVLDDLDALDKLLQNNGRLGWELVSHQVVRVETADIHHVTFKRPSDSTGV
jgi:hypothetical protein